MPNERPTSDSRPKRDAPTMGDTLRILILEDRPNDAELMLHEMRREKIACTALRVETEEDFRKQLHEFRPGLILADHALPTYDGMSALAAAQQTSPDVPFIFVSGNRGEEAAVESLHRGATDYIFKERLFRLGPAVRRAQDEVEKKNELKLAAQHLGESETRYRRLFESAKDGVLIVDAESGMVLDVNPFLTELLGLSHHQFLGKKVWELGFLKDLVANQDAFVELQEKEYIRYDNLALETSEGRPIDVEFVSNVYLVNDRKVIQCNIRDITDRKRAQEALARLNERHQLILSSTAEGVIGLDTDGNHTFVNPVAARLLGYEAEDLLGRPSHSTWHHTRSDGSPYPAEACHVYSAFRDGKVSRADDEVFWRKDGTSFPAEYASTPMYTLGRLVGAVVTFTDITERRQAEGSLRLQGAVLNAAANPIVITDRAGTIQWVNTAFTALTGYGADEAVGKNPRDLVRSGIHDKPFYQNLWETILAGNVWQGEMTNRRKDGSLYPEAQTITPVKDAHGEITHFIAIKQDLTAQKRLEAQFHQAQRMEVVGRLAGGVAHDFNNLLTVIIGEVEMTLREGGLPGPIAESLGEIKHAADRACGLTRQLLAFSRRQLVEPVVLNLNDVVTDMNKMLARLIGEDVLITTSPGKNAGHIRADRGQIEQVITNLVINARDAMPAGGKVTLKTEDATLDAEYARSHADVAPGRYAVLSVSDTGIGMTDDVKAHLFEPFFTTKERGKGTGLGLATTFGIVKQCGGHISVYSELGIGTTIRVYLPRVEAVGTGSGGVAHAPSAGGNETILLVEDDAAVRRVTARILTARGYRVLEAGDAEEAMALAISSGLEISLLLTDVVLPTLGGRELAEKVKAVRPGIKVLFASGYTDDAIIQHQLLEQGIMLVQKPFTAELLSRKVREALGAGKV